MKITIGNDAEFILTKSGVPYSAIGLIGGTKKEPSPCKKGALQEDNVLAEININPASTVRQWENNIITVMRELRLRLPEDIEISTLSSALYDPIQLAHPLAQEFGCDPDVNAWTERFNKFAKLTGELAMLRSAGGHIHVGIDLENKEKLNLIRCLDAYIGTQLVILDPDSQRKLLYGKAGAMRFKPYGVEWRTPSNFWIHTKENREWIFNSVMYCANNFKALSEFVTSQVVDIINDNNPTGAIEYLQYLNNKTGFIPHKSIGV